MRGQWNRRIDLTGGSLLFLKGMKRAGIFLMILFLFFGLFVDAVGGEEEGGAPSFRIHPPGGAPLSPDAVPPGVAILTDPVTGEKKLGPVIEVDPDAFRPPAPEFSPHGMVMMIDAVTGERTLLPRVQMPPPPPSGPFPSLQLQRPRR